MVKPNVYLADLRHNYAGSLANDCMPLCVGYLKAVMDEDVPEVGSRLFAYPDRLWSAIEDAPPDVLMLSNYMWNEALSLHFARLMKQLRPQTLVVLGGPNLPLEPERQTAWVEARPEVDVYILGEGDFLASEVMQRYLEAGLDLDRLRGMELPSSIWRDPDGNMRRDGIRARARSVDEIPSPMLGGLFDEFFDGKLAPMLETNRGCPFKCTFCAQGTDWYTKVHHFEIERLKEEIDYAARKIGELSPRMGTLRIVDANFGMFERDVEICEHIGRVQADTGWPSYIDATTGKNRPDRVIRAIEKVNGALVVYQAVQSLDEDVLRRINRTNIKLDAYKDVMVHIRGRGLRSNSDLILALPGESLESHLGALRDLLNAGTDHMHNLQLVLLMGTELETLEAREEFAFESRFRVIPKMAGVYGGGKSVDVEEVVVATDTLSFDDYLTAREYHLAISGFWNNDWFDDAIAMAESFELTKWEWLEAVVARMRIDTGDVGAWREAFLGETRGELFDTREACADYYCEEGNFQRLLTGEIGNNLIYKYRAVASFHAWPAIVRCAMEATRELLLERGAAEAIPGFEPFWEDFTRYLELGHAWGRSAQEVLADARGELSHDVEAWLAAGRPRDLAPFTHAAPVTYDFLYDEESRRLMSDALDVWSVELSGLTRLVTRTLPIWQHRRALRVS